MNLPIPILISFMNNCEQIISYNSTYITRGEEKLPFFLTPATLCPALYFYIKNQRYYVSLMPVRIIFSQITMRLFAADILIREPLFRKQKILQIQQHMIQDRPGLELFPSFPPQAESYPALYPAPSEAQRFPPKLHTGARKTVRSQPPCSFRLRSSAP